MDNSVRPCEPPKVAYQPHWQQLGRKPRVGWNSRLEWLTRANRARLSEQDLTGN